MQVTLLTKALLKKYKYTNMIFVFLIACSTALSIALISQERSLRQSSAIVANKMPVTVTAKGSSLDMLLLTSYLKAPSYAPDMIPKEQLIQMLQEKDAVFVAPFGFGDHYQGYPIIGTIKEWTDYISCIGGDSVKTCLAQNNNLASGSNFISMGSAVIGADVDLKLGQVFAANHGESNEYTHAGFPLRVTGRMKPSGTAWDRAILVPIEQVWYTHGLPSGHSRKNHGKLGPPFDVEFLSSVPAVFMGSYKPFALRSKYNNQHIMAFSAGNVLPRLYAIMGDIRGLFSILTLLTQIMVCAAIISAVLILLKLFQKNIGILRAIGAPQKYVFATLWSYMISLLLMGSILGFAMGYGIAKLISHYIAQKVGIAMIVTIGYSELMLIAMFLVISSLISTVPAIIAMGKSPIESLRNHT